MNTAGDGLRSAFRTEEEATAEQEPWSKRPRLPQTRELPPVPAYYETVGKRRMTKIRATLNTGWPIQHDVPGLHAPHMRWRQALRQALFATLAIYPDPMVDLDKLEAERDDHLIRWPGSAQPKFLIVNVLPTKVYLAAILDTAPRGTYSESGKPLRPISGLRTTDAAEAARIAEADKRWGTAPIAHAERMRSRLIFWAGDSGLLAYREKRASQPTIDLPWVANWANLTASIEAGASPKDWALALNEFINRYQGLLEAVGEVVEDP